MSDLLYSSKILIVGTGCFGISTAYHLLLRGYNNVTAIDRAQTLPAPDAASTDLNKVIRSAYEDNFYCNLAREAIQAWKHRDEWGDAYHESGFLLVGAGDSLYGDASLRNDVAAGARVTRIESDTEIKKIFPDGVPTGDLVKPPAILNQDGGWAAAADGVAATISKVRTLGGQIISGKKARDILRDENGKLRGVKCEDDSEIVAEVVVVATGSWTGSAFSGLDLDKRVFASGQGLATIQLSEMDAERYRGCPVVLDHISGFYIFPPNKDNIVKLSAHGAGYTHIPSGSSISTPRTILSDGQDGLRIPKDMVHHFRQALKTVYPELAEMPFQSTRLCWYTYTPDSDWVIDNINDDPSLFVATGGSGHAYKFLPVIGRLVADKIERKLTQELCHKFSMKRDRGSFTNWGWFAEPRPLNIETLCDDDDLKAS